MNIKTEPRKIGIEKERVHANKHSNAQQHERKKNRERRIGEGREENT